MTDPLDTANRAISTVREHTPSVQTALKVLAWMERELSEAETYTAIKKIVDGTEALTNPAPSAPVACHIERVESGFRELSATTPMGAADPRPDGWLLQHHFGLDRLSVAAAIVKVQNEKLAELCASRPDPLRRLRLAGLAVSGSRSRAARARGEAAGQHAVIKADRNFGAAV
jgi:hypothetical protein